ncbi:protein SMG7 isoform X2 [Mangifera indica]|uniref:protein SMG7 isoform X2 n=1 Tax=Mangifera indica TaxID=29780 RepID=UPI001CFA0B24|nr:protein SMG7 isoform X2 [Mangifera indica]
MMIVQMDKVSAPSSRERVQRLYEKNIELENKRRKSAQARVPSDPNAWQQMRENYETIILEDYAFSEQHNIEFALWQLHYKRIEELRAHYSAAISATRSNTCQGVKVPAKPDRVSKIRLQFKTFLSEATGFYHELILKIRAKYGLPLGHISEDSENQITMDKDGKKLAEVKKGLVSCHRCLIYLGDLARYKGLYGEGDSKSREYATASSYYLQSASLVPSSGNPHHQNRQIYSQMSGDVKLSTAKEHQRKGRGKGEAKLASRDTDIEASSVKEIVPSVQEMLKSFCTRFVRLNGILFTRTSLETFAEVLAFVSSGLCELLSSGPGEELSFGLDAAENALFIVRFISILVFTVHNLKKETENQTYAEIVQRAVLLQNAFTAVFELMGHVIERCIQLRDPSSSYLLPGLLVFVEWLACCPEIAAGSDGNEKLATVRTNFWNQCISFLNKILSLGPMSMDDDEDITCFFNMSRYDEGETENRLALWEDFELRGFSPLLPAHTILDFSRKHSFGGDINKERKARLKRILAAGKALTNVVTVDQKTVCFDSRVKKFLIGVEPSDDVTFSSYPDVSNSNDIVQENQTEKEIDLAVVQPNLELYMDGEEEDEVIVFKPAVTEKRADAIGSNWMSFDGLKPAHNASASDLQLHGGPVSAPINKLYQASTFDNSSQVPVSVASILPQQLQPFQLHASNWLMKEEASLANSLKGLRVSENEHVVKHDLQENIGVSFPDFGLVPIQQSVNASTSSLAYSHLKEPEAMIPPKIDAVAGVTFDSLAVKATSALPAGQRKNPVSRPVRHLGPPPGFSPVPSKQVTAPISASYLTSENPLIDDYSWLDGYRLPPSTRGLGISTNYPSHANPQYIGNSNGVTGTVSFPFPGKQAPAMQQLQFEKQKGWQDFQTFDHLKLQHEQQLQQQQLGNGNQQFAPLPEQYQGQSIWAGRYFV